MQFTVVSRIWNHPPMDGDVDHRGELRWCVLDEEFVYDHFATENKANEVAAKLEDADRESPLSD